MAVGLIANTLLSGAALAVGLSRSPAPVTPAFSPAERSSGQAYLCERYRLAELAVRIATNTPNVDAGIARNSLTNGALILESAAADPAIDSKYRDGAQALATAYQTQAAMGNTATVDQYNVAIADTTAKTYAMHDLCSE
ncbi:hypothetical protein [Mycolicibacter arupensis]|uniref:hypothetical protein n=1 Tax=Mycolicibacter arupensis TaxID=342002 RepID=UPI0023EFBDE0|nr:hypothetical protein [Mycolicibacter arupensis]